MPVVINEIQITAYVSDEAQGRQPAGSAVPAGSGSSTQPSEKIVQRCVEEVLRILQQKEER